jgi:arabinan endo-1,5-alpha-L-arabinosidase
LRKSIKMLLLLQLAAATRYKTSLTGVHDPSRITLDGLKARELYSTGLGVVTSIDRSAEAWSHSSPVFRQLPAWARRAVPKAANDDFWAPDVLDLGHIQRMYYAVSSFGSQISCIGLAELSIGQENWTDRGEVVCTKVGMNWNAIDPCPVVDPASGKAYMTLGSFWTGIYITTLDNATGKLEKDAKYLHIAANPKTSSNEIEASFLHCHNGTYFLFVNYGLCCRGVQSTYKIMVGKSEVITGPYVDKAGVHMTDGGGELFLATQGDEIGPGQVGIQTVPVGSTPKMPGQSDAVSTDMSTVFSYHFYSKAASGAATLGLRSLLWDKAGWPVAGPSLPS